jgi:hypothetical protein
MFRVLFSVLAVLNIAAASSSDHRRLKGEPLLESVSQKTSTIDLQDSVISRYFVSATYVDSGCTALGSADSYLLDTCFKESGKYTMYTATATSILTSTYSDAKCQTVVSSLPSVPYSDSCSQMAKKYIIKTTTVPSVPSVTPVAVQMLVHVLHMHVLQSPYQPTTPLTHIVYSEQILSCE